MAQDKVCRLLILSALIFILALPACGGDGSPPLLGEEAGESFWEAPASSRGLRATQAPTQVPAQTPDWGNSVTWEASDPDANNGIRMDTGGDMDTVAESWGDSHERIQHTGNGVAVPSDDGNSTEDYYLQFDIDDAFMYDGSPTSHVQIEVEYLDLGTDMFSIQYDASGEGGPFGDGRFTDTGFFIKTDSGEFKTAVFQLRDARFANRDNDADFRIADNGDGPELIRRVTVTLTLPSSDPQAPLYIDFYDDGNYLAPGQCTTLHWIVQNASDVVLDGSQVDPEGYRYVCPQSTTTYVLQAQNDGGDEQRSITVVIASPAESPGSLVYDFAVSCGPFPIAMGITGISYEISFEGQPGQISGPVTSHWYSSVDASHEFVLLYESFCNELPHGSTCQSGFQTSDQCCQIALIDNNDTNAANDIYTVCW